MMKRFFGIFFGSLLIITALISCEKNDDEPILPPTRISRLYVSFSDVQIDDLAPPIPNIAVFDPSDSLALDHPVYFNSEVDEGAGIYFNPYAKRVFQGSQNNFMIKTFSVNIMGVLGSASSFIDSTLTTQPALAYDHVSTNLYVSNNSTNSVHVYNRAMQKNGVLKSGPEKRFMLDGQPRGLLLDHDSLLIVLRTASENEIGLIENPSQVDSGIVNISKKIRVADASDLRGIAYSSKLNLLVVSDVLTSKIYFIENAREAFTQSSTITNEVSLGGALTQMAEPISVAIDDREDKMLLYVADRKNKTILRFQLSDRGNTAPESTYSFMQVPMEPRPTPVSIFLDAR